MLEFQETSKNKQKEFCDGVVDICKKQSAFIIFAEYSKSDNCSFCLHGGGQWMAKTIELTKTEEITTEYIQEVMKDILKILGEPSRE